MEVECFVTTEEIYQMIQELRKQAQKEQTENKITDNTEKEKTENTDISEEQNIDVALLFACERSIEMVKNYCYIEQTVKSDTYFLKLLSGRDKMKIKEGKDGYGKRV